MNKPMINDLAKVILSAVAGLLLGSLFFGGLWWTVKGSLLHKNHVLLFAGSLFLRTGLVLLGFYLACMSNWHHLVSCLLGFVAARLIVMVLLRLPSPDLISVDEVLRAP